MVRVPPRPISWVIPELPQKEKKKGFYAEVPVSLVFNGPFHNVAAFIDKIVHYPRIIKITSLSLTGPKEVEGHVMLKAACQWTTTRSYFRLKVIWPMISAIRLPWAWGLGVRMACQL